MKVKYELSDWLSINFNDFEIKYKGEFFGLYNVNSAAYYQNQVDNQTAVAILWELRQGNSIKELSIPLTKLDKYWHHLQELGKGY